MSSMHDIVNICRTYSQTIFYWTLLLPFFVITTAYKGSLVSILTIDVPKKPVDTMQELAKNNYSVGSSEIHACNQLKESQNQFANQLADYCSAFGNFDAGIELIREDPYFAISEGRAFSDHKRRILLSKE